MYSNPAWRLAYLNMFDNNDYDDLTMTTTTMMLMMMVMAVQNDIRPGTVRTHLIVVSIDRC